MQLGSGFGLKITKRAKPPAPPSNELRFNGEALTQNGEVISYSGG